MLHFPWDPGDADTGGPGPTFCGSGSSRAFLCTGAEVGGGRVEVSKPHGMFSGNFLARGPEKGQRCFRGVNGNWPGLDVWLGSACGDQAGGGNGKTLQLCHCCPERTPCRARPAPPRSCYCKGHWYKCFCTHGCFYNSCLELLSQNTSSDWLQSLQISLY